MPTNDYRSWAAIQELETGILDALGFRDRHIKRLVLTFEAGKPPTVDVTELLIDRADLESGVPGVTFGRFVVDQLHRFRLEPIDDQDTPTFARTPVRNDQGDVVTDLPLSERVRMTHEPYTGSYGQAIDSGNGLFLVRLDGADAWAELTVPRAWFEVIRADATPDV